MNRGDIWADLRVYCSNWDGFVGSWSSFLGFFFSFCRKRRTLTSIISIPVTVLDLEEEEPAVKGVNSSLECFEHLDFLLALINSFSSRTNIFSYQFFTIFVMDVFLSCHFFKGSCMETFEFTIKF